VPFFNMEKLDVVGLMDAPRTDVRREVAAIVAEFEAIIDRYERIASEIESRQVQRPRPERADGSPKLGRRAKLEAPP
jgi:hypothetical protein